MSDEVQVVPAGHSAAQRLRAGRVQPDGRQVIAPPVSAPGDFVVLRAELDLIVVLSACPQDMAPTNGADATPRDGHFTVLP
jgi:uncharacterized protein YcgI (DUF1989 family)